MALVPSVIRKKKLYHALSHVLHSLTLSRSVHVQELKKERNKKSYRKNKMKQTNYCNIQYSIKPIRYIYWLNHFNAVLNQFKIDILSKSTHTHKVTHLSDYHHSRRFLSFNCIHPVGNSRLYFLVVHLLKFGNKFCFLIFPNEVLQLFSYLKLLPSPPQLGSASIQELKGSLLRGKVHQTCKFSGNERDKGTMQFLFTNWWERRKLYNPNNVNFVIHPMFKNRYI